MKIVEFNGKHIDEIKELFVQLQEYLIEIDDENVLILSENYKDDYFQYVLKNINETDGIMYLAIEEDKVLGLITGVVEQPDEEDKIVNNCPVRGYVSEFVVDKNSRHKGVGKQLMDEIERWFETKGCDFIRIDVLAQNSSALEFYKNSGYTPINIEVSKRIKK